MARLVLKKLIISDLDHAPTTSLQGAEDPDYWKLGLTDAVIKTAALTQGCAVLTDDHDLYRLVHPLWRQELQLQSFSSARMTEPCIPAAFARI